MGRRPKEENLEIKYNGCLNGAKTIYLHYGIGENWEDVQEAKMRKLKYCYKTEITIPTGSELNFCFHDNDGKWDNNYENNYTYNSMAKNEEYSAVEIAQYVPKTKK